MYRQGEPIDKAKLEPTNVLSSKDVGFVKDTFVRCQNRASFAGGFGLSKHQQRSSTRNRKLPRIVAALRISRSKCHRDGLGRPSYGRSTIIDGAGNHIRPGGVLRHREWGLYEVGICGPDGMLVRIGWPSRLIKGE
jgi:hypothetical protein